jgi:hypothetical protein
MLEKRAAIKAEKDSDKQAFIELKKMAKVYGSVIKTEKKQARIQKKKERIQ